MTQSSEDQLIQIAVSAATDEIAQKYIINAVFRATRSDALRVEGVTRLWRKVCAERQRAKSIFHSIEDAERRRA